MLRNPLMATVLAFAMTAFPAHARGNCETACLEHIAEQYRSAYFSHDRSKAPFAAKLRFTENNVEMPFPDGSWDTVTEEVGTPLFLSDPKTGQAAIFTGIQQSETPGYLAIRLRIDDSKITEVEHMLSTRRNLSSPPTPFDDPHGFRRERDRSRPVPATERVSREDLIRIGDGYFKTLENNNGEIRDTAFAPDATRNENGMLFRDIEKSFREGNYAFNNRVRRKLVLVDEVRGIALFRGFIDHKGVMADFQLTTGVWKKSIFREPHSWALLEMFKIKKGMIAGVEATFIGAPYNSTSPWGPGNEP
jgi:hypothetical protein